MVKSTLVLLTVLALVGFVATAGCGKQTKQEPSKPIEEQDQKTPDTAVTPDTDAGTDMPKEDTDVAGIDDVDNTVGETMDDAMDGTMDDDMMNDTMDDDNTNFNDADGDGIPD